MEDRTSRALELMTRYAERTGLLGDGPERRYLWTDAYAVCNYLGLAGATGDPHYVELATHLVDRVHQVLGRHRPDDDRTGWISGLDEASGAERPTAGGLRIGKPLPERSAGEPVDPALEWDRDGQYFHYLTKWMHALDQLARVTGRTDVARWARELAIAAHRSFTRANQVYWKLSIDRTRPLVAAMGQHDALDGYITCRQLAESQPDPDLASAIRDFGAMIDSRALPTNDPLGIGGLLVDAARIAQLAHRGAFPGGREMCEIVLLSALFGLGAFAMHPELASPADDRLAFRELGIAIGLEAVTAVERAAIEKLGGQLPDLVRRIAEFTALGQAIEAFWSRPEHQAASSWREHVDINEVMLATSLVPDGFVVLQAIRDRRAA